MLVGNVTTSNAALPLGLAIIKGLEIIGSDSVSAAELDATFKFLDAKGIRPHIDRTLQLEDVRVYVCVCVRCDCAGLGLLRECCACQ